MKSPQFLMFAAAIFAVLVAPAHALVTVLGSSMAHDCFLAAKSRVDPLKGIATCTQALDTEAMLTKNRAATFVNRGVMEIAIGQTERAMVDFDAGLALTPDLGDAYVDRSAGLIALKRYDEAQADINKGMELGVSFPHIGYYNRGVLEELRGQFKEAYFDYKHALEIEPAFTLASDRLKFFIVTTKPAQGS